MNKELEEAIKALKNMSKTADEPFKFIMETILNYINNSTSNYVLYDLAREMRRNGSQYWANRLSEKISI